MILDHLFVYRGIVYIVLQTADPILSEPFLRHTLYLLYCFLNFAFEHMYTLFQIVKEAINTGAAVLQVPSVV